MFKRVGFTLCFAMLMVSCAKKYFSHRPTLLVGDKPIVIGDSKSVDIDDSGFLSQSDKSFKAYGDLKLRNGRLAAYQEKGGSKTDNCKGSGDCSITIEYAKDQVAPGLCDAHPDDNSCGTLTLTYDSTKNTLTLETRHTFQLKSGIYELDGYHVVKVTWPQGSKTPSDVSKKVSVSMCFVKTGDVDKSHCTF